MELPYLLMELSSNGARLKEVDNLVAYRFSIPRLQQKFGAALQLSHNRAETTYLQPPKYSCKTSNLLSAPSYLASVKTTLRCL